MQAIGVCREGEGLGLRLDPDAGGCRPRGHVARNGREERLDLDRCELQLERARLREADRAQVVDDPAEQARLFANRLEVAGLVPVHAIEDCRGCRIDHRERRLELVGGILEEAPASGVGGRQIGGHAVEGAPKRPQLIAPIAEPRACAQVPARNGCGGRLEPPERADETTGDEQAEHGRSRRRADGDDDERQRRFLLDLLGVHARSRTRSLSGPGRPAINSALGLERGEAAADNRRRADRDHDGRHHGDAGERDRETQAEAHGLAAR